MVRIRSQIQAIVLKLDKGMGNPNSSTYYCAPYSCCDEISMDAKLDILRGFRI